MDTLEALAFVSPMGELKREEGGGERKKEERGHGGRVNEIPGLSFACAATKIRRVRGRAVFSASPGCMRKKNRGEKRSDKGKRG